MMAYVVYAQAVQSMVKRYADKESVTKCIAWIYDRVGSTAIKSVCEFFLGHNLILKISVSIALAVILGPLFEIIVNAISNFFSSSYETVSITGAAPVGVSCALLGLTIGLLIHGAGGGIAAGLWGLILGMIAEATSEAYISDTLGPYTPNIILITHYAQPAGFGTHHEHMAVFQEIHDGTQQGSIPEGARRAPFS